MNKESPPISLEGDLDDELANVVKGEHNSVKREKFDLSSTREVLDKLLKEGLIKPDDKLSDVRAVVEEEFRKIESI